jgi:hypothetical protein
MSEGTDHRVISGDAVHDVSFYIVPELQFSRLPQSNMMPAGGYQRELCR